MNELKLCPLMFCLVGKTFKSINECTCIGEYCTWYAKYTVGDKVNYICSIKNLAYIE